MERYLKRGRVYMYNRFDRSVSIYRYVKFYHLMVGIVFIFLNTFWAFLSFKIPWCYDQKEF